MNKPSLEFKAADLVVYDHAAAGHDGVLSDPTGQVVIKPCTPAEIAFYETAINEHPDFAELLPTFYGTLELATAEQKQALSAESEDKAKTEGSAATLASDDPGPLHGKKLDTGKAIVLENIAAGFQKPNILDVKLGARLWDDNAPQAKRARLDKVASESTSASLGFRIAGMRVWRKDRGDVGEHEVFDKMYGRAFSAENVKNGFREFFLEKGSEKLSPARRTVLERSLHAVATMQDALESQESRMYSASILFVFEGHEEALEAAITKDLETVKPGEYGQDQEDDENDDEDGDEISVCKVKLIDFAHAQFAKGIGQDENALHGVRSVRTILETLLDSH